MEVPKSRNGQGSDAYEFINPQFNQALTDMLNDKQLISVILKRNPLTQQT